MIDKGYDSYGYDLSEQFVPLAVQCNTSYDGIKNKDGIKYTEAESFASEEGAKEAELVAPLCNFNKNQNVKLINDDETVNDRKTQN